MNQAAEPGGLETDSALSVEDSCPPLVVRSFGQTHPGRVRATNEDQFLIAKLAKSLQIQQSSLPGALVDDSLDQSHLFVVADGMGGCAAGETASALAIETVEDFVLNACQWFARCRSAEQDKVLDDFKAALARANARVVAEGKANCELHGMGTTLTLAYSLNDVLFVAHVGDSRCYLCHRGVLHRLTRDHTFVEEMIRRGFLTSEAAAHHRLRHVMTNAIGGDSPNVEVELHRIDLEPGDTILLCSDGLTDMLTDEEIAETLKSNVEPETVCNHLVQAANDMGGHDNITVIAARFGAAG